MLTVEDYCKIRLAHRDGLSIRQIARRFGHSRRKIRQVLQESEPRPYTLQRDRPAPRLGPYKALIEQVLSEDRQAPRKQQRTAAKLYRRLRDEHGYTGGYDQVRRYVRRVRRIRRETFLPLTHPPGRRLEADFGHIYVDFPDGRQGVSVLVLTWSFSGFRFAVALPSEKIEAILAGMVEGFAFFGCVPWEVWWDNPKTVATAILRGRRRRLQLRYAALASHYCFDPRFCMPARGNEKPYVENSVYDLQRDWATPVPRVRDLTELNAYLRSCALAKRDHVMAGKTQTVGELFEQDKQAALALPPRAFDPFVPEEAKVDKYQTVRFDTNRYSVPRRWAFETVTIKAYVDRIEVVYGLAVIARHKRSYARGEWIVEPQHYLAILGRRPAALDHSFVFARWELPEYFDRLRAEFEDRQGPQAGAQQYVRVLQLLAQYPLKVVQEAAQENAHYLRYLLRLVELESAQRSANALQAPIKQAAFPVYKDLDSYDFSLMPKLNKQKLVELTRCQWLDQRENLCLLGSQGVGKTHLAIALGLAACRAGRRGRFFTAAALVNRLEESQKQYQLDCFLSQLDRADLLICDELGYLSFSRTGAELLFQVFADRYERASLLVTSKPAVQRMGPDLPGRTHDGGLVGSIAPSLPHLRDERRELPVPGVSQKEQIRIGTTPLTA